MKSVLLPVCVLLLSWFTVALAQNWGEPYVPRDGAPVLRHYRSNSSER